MGSGQGPLENTRVVWGQGRAAPQGTVAGSRHQGGPIGQSPFLQPWCDQGNWYCCGSAWSHKSSLLDMAAPTQSSVFL